MYAETTLTHVRINSHTIGWLEEGLIFHKGAGKESVGNSHQDGLLAYLPSCFSRHSAFRLLYRAFSYTQILFAGGGIPRTVLQAGTLHLYTAIALIYSASCIVEWGKLLLLRIQSHLTFTHSFWQAGISTLS